MSSENLAKFGLRPSEIALVGIFCPLQTDEKCAWSLIAQRYIYPSPWNLAHWCSMRPWTLRNSENPLSVKSMTADSKSKCKRSVVFRPHLHFGSIISECSKIREIWNKWPYSAMIVICRLHIWFSLVPRPSELMWVGIEKNRKSDEKRLNRRENVLNHD